MFFFLMIRRPPRSTQSRSSAASDVYKRQGIYYSPLQEAFKIKEAYKRSQGRMEYLNFLLFTLQKLILLLQESKEIVFLRDRIIHSLNILLHCGNLILQFFQCLLLILQVDVNVHEMLL
eukprot:TRINITY_DN4500_c0_g1_i4.p1 TRINITY_DN4500_c0_g1~~TRINITY_DN4500_c0_g1_i4.p1  ORF type:complete len:119 (+),score=19.17 TRINITY_DN4500_c0_g1_i4:22-378(+)